MTDAILVLNAGSSSLKFSVFSAGDSPNLLLNGQFESMLTSPTFVVRDETGLLIDQLQWPAGSELTHLTAIEHLLAWGKKDRTLGGLKLTAAGHRVVHGGRKFVQPVLIDEQVLIELESLVPLAPLHQPHAISAIRAVTRHVPNLSQVACFDTSFHRTQPTIARRFALPRHLSESGIERYGFHGLSYEFIAARLPQIDASAAIGRTIVAHLGNGASLCAMRNGASIATTMGFTPLDGLVMGTRCGLIDPGVLIHLMDQRGWDVRSMEKILTKESGLLGVSGISSDMRTLLEKESTDEHASEAIELFVYRIVREIGSLIAALHGLDAIVFTGGIGEHAVAIRSRVCNELKWLGIELNESCNGRGDLRISSPTSRISAFVIPTNEELMIAEHARHLLKARLP